MSRPVVASSATTDDRARVLKHDDMFAVFDHYGDMKMGGLDEEGLYHDGTRFLSRLELQLFGRRPFFLSSTVRDGNHQLVVALTNPDILNEGKVTLPLGTLQVSIVKFLWSKSAYQQILIRNYGLSRIAFVAELVFAADYADIFEVRGRTRPGRGQDLLPRITRDMVMLSYRGLDGLVRRTKLCFEPAPTKLTASTASQELVLGPHEEIVLNLSVSCEVGDEEMACLGVDAARGDARRERALKRARSAEIATDNAHVDEWIQRAMSDLNMMTTELPSGPYPYAGVPWFNTPFGRDGIVTALECLWLNPGIARGVLKYLAATQATTSRADEDAEPGKILHETRGGEMAALKEMPFGRYYGSVDATPLYVMLAGAYYRRTGDIELINSLWPNVEAALSWIDRDGDLDGDGFIEYRRRAADGLIHQGWKDSDDAIFHADGTLADGPLALCEVQGYVYAAFKCASDLAAVLGQTGRASDLAARASKLAERFDRAFWCEELDTYALALDGNKRPCRVKTSNAGQCLYTGIVPPPRAERLARTLLGPKSFSGWGIRTVEEGMSRYNPMAYHNGSVWPHDTALIAGGLSRYGFGDLALKIWEGLFEAGMTFDLERMPELFCGFGKDSTETPILYPVACAPQAWAAASVFLVLQACLGVEVDGIRCMIRFQDPRLPPSIGELAIKNLTVGRGKLDLFVFRHGDDVGVKVTRREGARCAVLVE